MILTHFQKKYHNFKNGILSNRVLFYGASNEISQYLPNTDENGIPISEGSEFRVTNNEDIYKYTGYEWHKVGDEPTPPAPTNKAKLYCESFFGTIGCYKRSTINLERGKEITLPIDINDHPYAYLPTNNTEIKEKIILKNEDGEDIPFTYNNKNITFTLPDNNNSIYHLTFFGADIFSIVDGKYSKFYGSFGTLTNCDLYNIIDNKSYFVAKHSKEKITLNYTPMDNIPMFSKIQESSLSSELEWDSDGNISFVLNHNAFNKPFILSYVSVVNFHFYPFAAYLNNNKNESHAMIETSENTFIPMKIDSSSWFKNMTYEAQDLDELAYKLFIEINGQFVDIKTVCKDYVPGQGFYLDTSKIKDDVSIQFYGADMINILWKDFDTIPEISSTKNLSRYKDNLYMVNANKSSSSFIYSYPTDQAIESITSDSPYVEDLWVRASEQAYFLLRHNSPFNNIYINAQTEYRETFVTICSSDANVDGVINETRIKRVNTRGRYFVPIEYLMQDPDSWKATDRNSFINKLLIHHDFNKTEYSFTHYDVNNDHYGVWLDTTEASKIGVIFSAYDMVLFNTFGEHIPTINLLKTSYQIFQKQWNFETSQWSATGIKYCTSKDGKKTIVTNEAFQDVSSVEFDKKFGGSTKAYLELPSSFHLNGTSESPLSSHLGLGEIYFKKVTNKKIKNKNSKTTSKKKGK